MPTVTNLPTPDFTFDPHAPGACVAGVRPYRTGSYRLDTENAAGRLLVHNYGHGGAGITLSWGCAARVRDIVAARVAASPDTTVAILGAGVMGLTAATVLADLGLSVTVYADREPLGTTSAKAGGQWAVSVVEYQGREQEFAAIVKNSYTRFKGSIGHGFGVHERPNYAAKPSHNLEVVRQLVPGLIPDPVSLPRMPFEGHTKSGLEYRTLLVEPPVFLARLHGDLLARGVDFVVRRFISRADVLAAVPDPVIVNCTGMGAKALFNDAAMVPIKGQLAMLPPQPQLKYLYGQDGYLFPRSDHVVVGGTFEYGVDDETADVITCQKLVDYMAGLFGQVPAVPMPRIHIHHPDHAGVVDPVLPNPVSPDLNV